MAQVTTVTNVDDYDGTEADERAGVAVSEFVYALDGEVFAIDLTDTNQSKFRAGIAAYHDKAHRVGKLPRELRTPSGRTSAASSPSSSGTRPSSTKNPAVAEAREWLAENRPDLTVSIRGRLSQESKDALPAGLRSQVG